MHLVTTADSIAFTMVWRTMVKAACTHPCVRRHAKHMAICNQRMQPRSLPCFSAFSCGRYGNHVPLPSFNGHGYESLRVDHRLNTMPNRCSSWHYLQTHSVHTVFHMATPTCVWHVIWNVQIPESGKQLAIRAPLTQSDECVGTIRAHCVLVVFAH